MIDGKLEDFERNTLAQKLPEVWRYVVKLEAENAELKAECEILLWNLAGCDTYAMGYGLEKEHAEKMARPALATVRRLALRAQKLEAVAKAAEEYLKRTGHDYIDGIGKTLQDALAALEAKP